MRLMNRKTLSALAAVGALAVAGCGDDDTSGESGSSAAGNGVDRAFVADMIPHHESAIEMANIAGQRGESPFVKQLAQDIVTSQAKEISTMRREDAALASAGVQRGSLGVPEHQMGMDHDAKTLETADPFDPAFIKMMIPHHEGAVTMAKVEIDKGESPALKKLAQEIIDAQEREIGEMRKHLASSGEGDKAVDEDHTTEDDAGGGHSG